MGTIGFNAGQITSIASQAMDDCGRLNKSFNAIKNQLDILSNEGNWSGPIKGTANTDFQNARESMDGLNKAINSSFEILKNIGNNFKNIQY